MWVAPARVDSEGWDARAEADLSRCEESARSAESDDAACLARVVLSAYRALAASPAATVRGDDDDAQRLLRLYDAALDRLVRIGLDRWGHLARWPRTLGSSELPLSLSFEDAPGGRADFFDRFVRADAVDIGGLRWRYRRPGLGVALVGERDNAPPRRATEPGVPIEGEVYPLTLVLQPAAGGGVVLRLLDAHLMQFVPVGHRRISTAADVSAAYATLLASASLDSRELSWVFRTETIGAHHGLFRMQPYDRDKIPVVLVHGLKSSAFTWRQLTNEIWGDPELERRYQIWHYMYPTGSPILFNAADLREALAQVRRDLDPEGDDPAMQDMVLIGHSMGGLLSKLMIQESGERLWDGLFTRSFGSLALTPEERRQAERIYFFKPVPSVRRVVFIATPHRGSELAGGWLARWVSSAVSLPRRFVALRQRLNAIAAPKIFSTLLPTSIDVLSPAHPVIQALAAIPPRPGVPYNSIVGDRLGAGRLDGSDGVVPDWSSHLDGAESELVIASGHNAHEHPAALNEVRRILRLHALEPSSSSQLR